VEGEAFMQQTNVAKQLPIGYWLKRADEVLTQYINQLHQNRGFTRSRWQTLNLIHDAGTITREKAFATMSAFIDAQQFDEILESFYKQGWLLLRGEGNSAELSLTEAGKIERAILLKAQQEARSRILQGISEEEYNTVIRVLQRMIANLE
jgi:DNA-binding MarR family transcriptional regulator